MRKKYKVHLRSGTTIKVKGDDAIVNWQDGEITGWEIKNASRWLTFMPGDLVAIERLRWFK